MVPRASRNVREGWPLGKAARATRAVASGTGTMTCGWSDMTDILLLRGGRHHSYRGRIMPESTRQGHHAGEKTLWIYFFTTKIFSVVNIEKRLSFGHAKARGCRLISSLNYFILVYNI